MIYNRGDLLMPVGGNGYRQDWGCVSKKSGRALLLVTYCMQMGVGAEWNCYIVGTDGRPYYYPGKVLERELNRIFQVVATGLDIHVVCKNKRGKDGK